MKKIIYSYIVPFLIAISCNKPSEEKVNLPSGENTAYFYLDGALIIPKGRGVVPPTKKAISFSGCQSPNNNFRLSLSDTTVELNIIFINGIDNLDTINLMNGIDDCCFTDKNASFLSIQNQLWYEYKTLDNSGKVNITSLSTNKRKITGTFEINVTSTTGEVKKITNGHFNVDLDKL